MHDLLRGSLLVGAGFLFTTGLLGLTRPSVTSKHCPKSSSTVSSSALIAMPEIELPAPPKFWKINEPETWAAAAASRTFREEDFVTPGSRVPSPLEAAIFLHQPDRVVEMFRECEVDPNCYIAYFHVPKTGGTSVEEALSTVFNQTHESSCCGWWMLRTFKQQVDHFCQNKYTSWQMSSPMMFYEVLDTCFQRNVEQNRRVLILISYREPVSMTLSFIHQRCNKNFEKRAEYIQKACIACQYEEYQDVWDRFATITHDHFVGAWRVWHLLQDNYTNYEGNQTQYDLPLDRMQMALLEPNDLDEFLTAWHPEINFTKANPENLDFCQFRLPKEYIEKHAPAAEWYRRFVSGVAG